MQKRHYESPAASNRRVLMTWYSSMQSVPHQLSVTRHSFTQRVVDAARIRSFNTSATASRGSTVTETRIRSSNGARDRQASGETGSRRPLNACSVAANEPLLLFPGNRGNARSRERCARSRISLTRQQFIPTACSRSRRLYL